MEKLEPHRQQQELRYQQLEPHPMPLPMAPDPIQLPPSPATAPAPAFGHVSVPSLQAYAAANDLESQEQAFNAFQREVSINNAAIAAAIAASRPPSSSLGAATRTPDARMRLSPSSLAVSPQSTFARPPDQVALTHTTSLEALQRAAVSSPFSPSPSLSKLAMLRFGSILPVAPAAVKNTVVKTKKLVGSASVSEIRYGAGLKLGDRRPPR